MGIKILIFSDSHGNSKKMNEMIQKLGGSGLISAVIHLGDCFCDILAAGKAFPHIPFYRVAGNCDRCSVYGQDAGEKLLKIVDKNIFITHGHTYGVKSGLTTLKLKAAKEQADICLFGHTHIPFMESEKILLLNPGSIAYPRGRYGASYGIVDIAENGVVSGNVVEVTPFGNRPVF